MDAREVARVLDTLPEAHPARRQLADRVRLRPVGS